MTDKWINADAGPRQVKDLEKAIGKLTWEGRTHIELTGVVGGPERRSCYVNLFGGCRAEATELDAKIREQYSYQVTRKNVREIIAAYEAAATEAVASRHVADKRRSPGEDARVKALVAERDAADTARRDAEQALLGQVMAKAPEGARALIVAELHEDTSDSQSDYFANKTVRTVAIGWRFSSREDFKALAAAAAAFGETAGLEFTERRDNYSMGKGNYLSDHGWDGAGSGWVVKSRGLPCRWVNLTEDAIPDLPAAPAVSGGTVTVSPSSLGRPGVVEVRFAEKPPAETREGLKAHGFRWARTNGCWYGRDTAYADALAATTEGAAA